MQQLQQALAQQKEAKEKPQTQFPTLSTIANPSVQRDDAGNWLVHHVDDADDEREAELVLALAEDDDRPSDADEYGPADGMGARGSNGRHQYSAGGAEGGEVDTTSWHGRWVASATAGWGVEDAAVFQGLVAEAREVVSRREFEAAARLVAATMLADVADALWRAVERLAGRVGRWGLCESVRVRVCLCVRAFSCVGVFVVSGAVCNRYGVSCWCYNNEQHAQYHVLLGFFFLGCAPANVFCRLKSRSWPMTSRPSLQHF